MKTLVCMYSNTNAHRITGEPFINNVLKPLGADLALCVKEGEPDNIFYQNAKYVWKHPPVKDWVKKFDEISGNQEWQIIMNTEGHWFGACDQIKGHNMNAAVILYYRWLLLNHLRDIRDQYDWIIVSRSDFLWCSLHCQMELLNKNTVYLLDGPQYGGLNDAHIILPSNKIDNYLDILIRVLQDPENVINKMHPNGNQEKLVKAMCDCSNIYFLPLTSYFVREKDGPPSWSMGVWSEQHGYYIKIPDYYCLCELYLQAALLFPNLYAFWKTSLEKKLVDHKLNEWS